MICEKCRKLVRDYKADYCICSDCYADYNAEFVQVIKDDLEKWQPLILKMFNNSITFSGEYLELRDMLSKIKNYLGEKGGN